MTSPKDSATYDIPPTPPLERLVGAVYLSKGSRPCKLLRLCGCEHVSGTHFSVALSYEGRWRTFGDDSHVTREEVEKAWADNLLVRYDPIADNDGQVIAYMTEMGRSGATDKAVRALYYRLAQIEAIVPLVPEPEEDLWEQVGEITVDAGLCWVGDPSYFTPRDARDHPKSPRFKDWGTFLESIGEEYPTVAALSHVHEYEGLDGNRETREVSGLGVCVSTGYGDGRYPVYVHRNEEGRIEELRVVFIESEE